MWYNLIMKLLENTKIKLKESGVGIVYLFGSRAVGVALNKSDYDIGVVFINPKIVFSNPDKTHSVLYDVLSNEFPDTFKGPRLDISFLQESNPALEIAAVNYGKVLFENNPTFRVNYEEGVIRRYDDYLTLKKEYEQATFSAFIR